MIDTHFVLALFHIFIVVPFFLYIFIQRAATPEYIYNILFFVGLFILVYHTYKALLKYSTNSLSLWINLIHIFIIAPLLIYIGYYGKKTNRAAYELLGLTTFAALGYHLFNLIKVSQIVDLDD
jgi:hypothetical protein